MVSEFYTWGSALRRVSLSFASPKESKQRKGDPWVGAGRCPVPCATRNAGLLAKLAYGSNNASRLPPALLRCSAPLKGPGKALRCDGTAWEVKTFEFCSQKNNGLTQEHKENACFCGRPQQNIKNEYDTIPREVLPGPHVQRRATEKPAEKGRALFEARRAELRSPRRFRVAQGSRRSRPRNLGSPFLWLLSFGEAKESTPALKAEPQANSSTPK